MLDANIQTMTISGGWTWQGGGPGKKWRSRRQGEQPFCKPGVGRKPSKGLFQHLLEQKLNHISSYYPPISCVTLGQW